VEAVVLATRGPERDTARAMSQGNVEIVRAICQEWERGDFSRGDWADPDIEFFSALRGLEEGTQNGREAMGSSWRRFLSAWQDIRVEAEEIIDTGSQVLVVTHFGGRGRGSGIPAEALRGAALFSFRNGRVVRLALYSDRAAALEAVGLSE
jgi:ketosteroid isomerase-like protein